MIAAHRGSGRLAQALGFTLNVHLHNKRVSGPNWFLRYHWSRWPAITLRGAIVKAVNFERNRNGRRDWWFWQQNRLRMVAYYAERHGAVPEILLQRRVPKDPFALSRDTAFKKWYRGAA